MKKRALSLILALVLLTALLPQTVLTTHAAASGSCGENLTWSFDEETGTLTITGSGAMTKWSAPERTPWNEHRAQIKSVILPNGLTNIGSCAFDNCEALKKIVLPDSVTDIGKSAFSQCTALTGLSMPDGLLRIGNNAFYNCTELETVMIPNTVTRIGQHSFFGCEKLTQVVLPEELFLIGTGAFSKSGIIEVTIPKSVKSIERAVFKDCSGLKKATINSSATGSDTFLNCPNLTEVALNGKTSAIRYGIFDQCASLKKVNIPKTVTRVESCAFRGCTSLEEVNLPDGIQTIQFNAFLDCTSLKSVYLPETCTSIYDNAFKNCTSLESITVVNPDCNIYSNRYTLGTPGTTTVYGYAGSTAQSRAKNKGFTFSTELDALAKPVVKTSHERTTGYIKLSWKEVEGAVKYQVYRSGDLIGTTKSLSFVDSEAQMLWPSGGYYYRVKAVAADSIRSSGRSKQKYAEVYYPTPEVTGKGVKEDGRYLISLKWEKLENVESFEIYRATEKDGSYKKIYTLDSTDFINYPDGHCWHKDRNVTLGKTYYYKFKSKDGNGHTSMFSPILSVKCGLARPVVTASNLASTGKIKLTWKKVPNAVNYKIYRAISKTGSYQLVKTTTSLNWTDTDAVAGKTYYYRVKATATNSKANSLYSLTVEKTCKLARPEVTVKRTDAGKPKLSWKAISGAKGYEVLRSEQPAGSFTLIRTVTSGTTYTNTGAEAGKTYFYKVRAIASRTEANSVCSAVAGITAK